MAKVTFALFGFGNMGWYAYVIGFKMKFTNVVIESFRFTYFTCTDQGGGGAPHPSKIQISFNYINMILPKVCFRPPPPSPENSVNHQPIPPKSFLDGSAHVFIKDKNLQKSSIDQKFYLRCLDCQGILLRTSHQFKNKEKITCPA